MPSSRMVWELRILAIVHALVCQLRYLPTLIHNAVALFPPSQWSLRVFLVLLGTPPRLRPAMGRAAFPELMDTGYASWDDVGYFCRRYLLMSSISIADVEFCIPISSRIGNIMMPARSSSISASHAFERRATA